LQIGKRPIFAGLSPAKEPCIFTKEPYEDTWVDKQQGSFVNIQGSFAGESPAKMGPMKTPGWISNRANTADLCYIL